MVHGKMLSDRVRDQLRISECGIKSEQSYVVWIMRFMAFHNMRAPVEMGVLEVGAFMRSLAADGAVEAFEFKQAGDALHFLYEQVLRRPL